MSETKAKVKVRGRPFVKGDPRINRKGKPVGTRSRFSKAFVDAMLADFEEHGTDIVTKVRTEDPSTYIRIAAALIPAKSEQEIEVRDTSQEKVSEIDWDVITGGKAVEKRGRRATHLRGKVAT
jgi:hypothetical protein|tara:strand:- start:3632 stop:4000 length:369 start_codon:yes stop_codon:yes gene_type:complete